MWNDKAGQRQERTEWHNIDLWGKQAESLSEYLVKGKQVYIEGRLQTDEYTDKEGDEAQEHQGALRARGAARRRWRRTRQRRQRWTAATAAAERRPPSHDEASEPLTDDDIPF